MSSPKPKNSDWYDTIYQKSVKSVVQPVHQEEHLNFIVKYCTGSILDLGCGLGLLADRIPARYLGIDFSQFAIDYASAHCNNPDATFLCEELTARKFYERFDTVVLSEVLEHIKFPDRLVDYAKEYCRKRLIVTVPVNMPIASHFTPVWTKRYILEMFGLHPLVIEQGCSTPKKHNIHWHFVYEI